MARAAGGPARDRGRDPGADVRDVPRVHDPGGQPGGGRGDLRRRGDGPCRPRALDGAHRGRVDARDVGLPAATAPRALAGARGEAPPVPAGVRRGDGAGRRLAARRVPCDRWHEGVRGGLRAAREGRRALDRERGRLRPRAVGAARVDVGPARSRRRGPRDPDARGPRVPRLDPVGRRQGLPPLRRRVLPGAPRWARPRRGGDARALLPRGAPVPARHVERGLARARSSWRASASRDTRTRRTSTRRGRTSTPTIPRHVSPSSGSVPTDGSPSALLYRETESGGSGWRNIRVRLEDGTWEEVGPRGSSLHPTPGPWWDAAATASHEGHGLFLLHSSANPVSALGTEERLIDGVTGRELGSDSAAATPEGRERLLASEERRLTPVRLSGGRRAWARGNRIQWESQAGPVAEFSLSNATTIELGTRGGGCSGKEPSAWRSSRSPWTRPPSSRRSGRQGTTRAPTSSPPTACAPCGAPTARGRTAISSSMRTGERPRPSGSSVSDQTITQEGGRVLVWSRGKAGAPGQALLVDLESGTRTPVAAEDGIPSDLVGVYSVGRLADGRHVLRGSSSLRAPATCSSTSPRAR